MEGAEIDQRTLDEMVEYYRARAPEYEQWLYRKGAYDLGPEANSRWAAELAEVAEALDRFRIEGDVLELAGGTGVWTERLARTARRVTVIDASLEMLAFNRTRVSSDRVRYVVANLFTWRPDRIYDAACIAFWLSHVPNERLDSFLAMVASALRPGGKIFFVDSRRNSVSGQDAKDRATQIERRRLEDGREFHVVKNYLEPSTLWPHFQAAGLDVDVRETATYFTYGIGTRREG